MNRLASIAVLALAGCAAPAAPPQPDPDPVPAPSSAAPRDCPPLPILRAGASSLERRVHTQTIVRMYADCAGAGDAQ